MSHHSYYAPVGPAHVLTPPGDPASVALERVQRVIGEIYASHSARTLR